VATIYYVVLYADYEGHSRPWWIGTDAEEAVTIVKHYRAQVTQLAEQYGDEYDWNAIPEDIYIRVSGLLGLDPKRVCLSRWPPKDMEQNGTQAECCCDEFGLGIGEMLLS